MTGFEEAQDGLEMAWLSGFGSVWRWRPNLAGLWLVVILALIVFAIGVFTGRIDEP
jgi:hypothetical protein